MRGPLGRQTFDVYTIPPVVNIFSPALRKKEQITLLTPFFILRDMRSQIQ